MDQAVRELATGLPPRTAVVALGGYGRRSLSPGSDVDLMVLHAERRPGRVREAAERLFYPFWDAGIPLGHAVRTVDESLAEAGRLDVATALLDARVVSGDPSLAEDLDGRLLGRLRRDHRRFLGELRAARAERRDRFGSCAELLEPDLKEGTGGLRDVHTVGWAGRVVDAAGVEDLVARGLLRAREAEELGAAEEFLVRLRSALHLETGRRSDRVFLEHQPALARAMGYDATAGLDAPDALMRALFEHARQVEHIVGSLLDRAETTEDGEERQPGTGDQAMAAFAAAAGTGRPLSPGLLDAAEGLEAAWTEPARRAFLEILAAGEDGARVLEALDRIGYLARLIPEWDPVRCRPQRDPYHVFSVDIHLVRTAAEAARLLAGDTEDPVAKEAAGSADRDTVLLGAFLHDIGKVGRGHHVPTGVRMAERILDRMDLDPERREGVLFLVREHLLLADTATRRDLSDENLVLDVAARIEEPPRLAMLYLVTAADARATGPHAWTPWRQALVRELVGKVERVLERGDMDATRASSLENRTAAVRDHLAGEEPPAVEAYLARLPRPYLLSVDPELVAEHYPLLAPALPTGEVRTRSRPGDREGTHELTVVAADRPGLLARIAGALSLSGLNILSARAFTTEDGVAIDLFTVEPAFTGEVDEERWRRFRGDLRKALEGRIALDHRVREKRRHYPPSRVATPTDVRVDNGASDFFTVIEVHAPDRIGLLYDVCRAFHELELDVHLAKVATYGGRVVDAFYVRDLFGRKVEDEAHRREIERAVLAAVRD